MPITMLGFKTKYFDFLPQIQTILPTVSNPLFMFVLTVFRWHDDTQNTLEERMT
jgi:hypothetical protein